VHGTPAYATRENSATRAASAMGGVQAALMPAPRDGAHPPPEEERRP